ncbi:MAG: hypothetical protein H6710_19900 [Myxococcales bacterium]|nr:hypothetical protein [Myxococcales bacterium]MCB9706223.1 hypothetical protein [Myxococcales bacterium]
MGVALASPAIVEGSLHAAAQSSAIVHQGQDPEWPIMIDALDRAHTGGFWLDRSLHRRDLRPVSATLVHLLPGRAPYHPAPYFALLALLHGIAVALVHRLGRRVGGERGAIAGALIFAVHPAAAFEVWHGAYSEFLLGALFTLAGLASILASADAGWRRSTWLLGLVLLAAAVGCEESFVAGPIIALLWLRALGLGAGLGRGRLAALLGAGLLPGLAYWLHHFATLAPYGLAYANGPTPQPPLLRFICLALDPYFHVRRTLALFRADQGPWFESAIGASSFGAEVYAVELPLTILAVAGLLFLARRVGALRVGLLAMILPAILLAAHPTICRTWELVLGNRYPGLRQAYVFAAFWALFVALVGGRLLADARPRRRLAAAAAIAALVGWELHVAVQVRAAVTEKAAKIAATTAAAGCALPAELPRGAHVYLFGEPGLRTDAAPIWWMLERGDLDLRFETITYSDEPGPADAILRRDARTLEIRRADGSPYPWIEWAREPEEGRLGRWLAAGGRIVINGFRHPIRSPGTVFPLNLIPEDRVTILEVEGPLIRAISLEIAAGVDAPTTVLVATQGGRMVRVRCPKDHAPCATEPYDPSPREACR